MTTGTYMSNACATCKHCKKGFFGKYKCTLQKIKTKAEHLCYAYEKKEKK